MQSSRAKGVVMVCPLVWTGAQTALSVCTMPYADPERRKQHKRDRAAKRRSLGLCANGEHLARPGMALCKACQDAQTRYKREARERARTGQ